MDKPSILKHLNDLLITFQVKILMMSFISFGIQPRSEAPGDLLAEFHNRSNRYRVSQTFPSYVAQSWP